MASPLKKLSKRRQHDWRVIFAYELTYDEARVMTHGPEAGEAQVELNTAKVKDASRVSCWKCELPFEKVSELPCTGKPKMNGSGGQDGGS